MFALSLALLSDLISNETVGNVIYTLSDNHSTHQNNVDDPSVTNHIVANTLMRQVGTARTAWLPTAQPQASSEVNQSTKGNTQDPYIVAAQWVGIIVLNLLSALFSGLVLGLLSLDVTELEVLKKCGTEKERQYAAAIIPMRKRNNLLLCSLVIGNVVVNSGLQLLLDIVFPGVVGFVSTTICVTIVGEILPQAVCARYGLAIGAKTIWITWIVIILTFPVSYPLSKVLDWSLGEEIAFVFDRERLQEYIRITRHYNNLDAQEINIITGALKIKKVTVAQVMTKLRDVFMLNVETIIDHRTMVAIVKRGFSRIPVYSGSKRNLVGLLMVKDLALVNPQSEISLRSLLTFYKHPIMNVDEYHTLDVALNHFREGRSHLAFVRDHKSREILGIVTLEDIIEEVLQVEINDETDIVTDNRELKLRPDVQIPANVEAFHQHSNEKRHLRHLRPSDLATAARCLQHHSPATIMARVDKSNSKEKKKIDVPNEKKHSHN